MHGQLSDTYPLNKNFVYLPADCYYPLRRGSELVEELEARNIVAIVFRGDSQVREVFQSLITFLAHEFVDENTGAKLDPPITCTSSPDLWVSLKPLTTRSGM